MGRFSIANLLGLVLFLAVGLAALREATDLWDSAVFTGTLALLLVSILLAVHRTERTCGKARYDHAFIA